MRRISLYDSIEHIIIAMSQGNPGAMNVLLQMFAPDTPGVNFFPFSERVLCVMFLDEIGIYGTDIYVLYNDICDRDILKAFAVIKATQEGDFPSATLKDACHRQDYSGREMVPVNDLLATIKERYPGLGRESIHAFGSNESAAPK